jgi:hypothetical protein
MDGSAATLPFAMTPQQYYDLLAHSVNQRNIEKDLGLIRQKNRPCGGKLLDR